MQSSEAAKVVAEYVLNMSQLVVANVGLHYHHFEAIRRRGSTSDRLGLSWRSDNTDHRLRQDYSQLASHFAKFNAEAKAMGLRRTAVFSETTPQHFQTKDGSGDYDSPGRAYKCGSASRAEAHDWRNKILHEVALKSSVQVVRVHRALTPLHQHHQTNVGDCTHFCYAVSYTHLTLPTILLV